MAKNPTSWSNNDNKNATRWSGSSKNSSRWANNVTKNATTYTRPSKNSTGWNSATNAGSPYLYDDPTRLWADTPILGYDYTIPTTNTLNNKNITAWSAA